MVGHARIANSAEKDRIVALNAIETIVWHHLADTLIAIAGPIKFIPLERNAEFSARSFQHTNAFRHYFLADTVASNYCDAVHNTHLTLFH